MFELRPLIIGGATGLNIILGYVKASDAAHRDGIMRFEDGKIAAWYCERDPTVDMSYSQNRIYDLAFT
jgi:hypothetical protein